MGAKKRILYVVLPDEKSSSYRHLWGWHLGDGGDLHVRNGNEMARLVGGGIPVLEDGWSVVDPSGFAHEILVVVAPVSAWKKAVASLGITPADGSVFAAYSGPWTASPRIAGPFCCEDDAAGFAKDDSGGAEQMEIWTMKRGSWTKSA